MRPLYYDRMGQPIDRETFARSFESHADKVVKQDTIGEFFVSTVWLGIDHGPDEQGRPVIFETMVFPDERHVERYATEEDARAGHLRAVEMAKTGKFEVTP